MGGKKGMAELETGKGEYYFCTKIQIIESWFEEDRRGDVSIPCREDER